MLSVAKFALHAECCYAECRYAVCRYAERRRAYLGRPIIFY
jgi:hypothetical protein